MIIESSRLCAFLVPLYFLTSSNTNIKTSESGALTAVGNERLFFAEFHLERLPDKLREFTLNPLAIFFAALYTNDKIICIANIFELFIRLRGAWSFQELFSECLTLSNHAVSFCSILSVDMVAKIFDSVVQFTVFRSDLSLFRSVKFVF